MKTGLAALIHPLSIEEFNDKFEKNEPVVLHNSDISHLRSFFELPFLKSLEDMLNTWPHKIQAHLPDLRDEVSAIDSNSVDAKKLFTNGMGLLFNNVHAQSDFLKNNLEEIRSQLGLSQLTNSRCLVYATPKGKGTATHFDQNINLVLQIQGHKTWLMAPNEQVENPLTRHTMGLPVDHEMQSYINGDMPMKMPNNTQKIDLKPGSFLFVPRGYWHQTHAHEDALSLNFTFTAATWIDLFTVALRSRLILSPDWRETAILKNNNSDTEDKFNALLSSIANDLPNWEAGDILDFIEHKDNFYSKN